MKKLFAFSLIFALALGFAVSANAAVCNVKNNTANDSVTNCSSKNRRILNFTSTQNATILTSETINVNTGSTVKAGGDLKNVSVGSGNVTLDVSNEIDVNSLYVDVASNATSSESVNIEGNTTENSTVNATASDVAVQNITDKSNVIYKASEELNVSSGNKVKADDDITNLSVVTGSVSVTKKNAKFFGFREYRLSN